MQIALIKVFYILTTFERHGSVVKIVMYKNSENSVFEYFFKIVFKYFGEIQRTCSRSI